MLTYKKIITLLRYFADNHGQIKSTGYGQISSIAQVQNIQYPLMFISPSSSSIGDQVLDLEFNVLIMDRLQDSLDNEVEIHSDMLSIASDLRVWLNTDASDYFSVIESSNVQFFSERFGDYLGGVNLKIKINAEWDWNSCTIPGLELNWNENGDIIQPNYFYLNFLPLSGGTLTGCIDAPCYLSGGTPLETIIYNIASVYSGGSTSNLTFSAGTNLLLTTGSTSPNITYRVNPNLSITNISANTALLQSATVVGTLTPGEINNQGNLYNYAGGVYTNSIDSNIYYSGGTPIEDYLKTNVIYLGNNQSLIEGQTGNTVNLYGLHNDDGNITFGYHSSGQDIDIDLAKKILVNVVSARTEFYSGSTNLETIIYNIASGSSTPVVGTNVQPGINTYTGGTSTRPTINVSALTIDTLIASGNSIFSGTLSGGSSFSANTLFSGTTNLNTYFGQLQASAITNANNISQNSNILATKANISGQTFTGNIVVPTITASTIFSGTTNLVNLLSKDISANRIKGSTANRYHTSTNVGYATTNQAVTNGRLVFCPFLVGEQITLDRIGVSLAASSTTTSNVIRLGIYNCDANHIPSTLLLDAGTVTASATTNLITISISQQLNPGLYYLAMLADYTVASAIRGIPTTAFQNPLGWSSNPTLGITGYYYNDVGYGALPSSAGSLTTSTLAIPAIFVRIA